MSLSSIFRFLRVASLGLSLGIFGAVTFSAATDSTKTSSTTTVVGTTAASRASVSTPTAPVAQTTTSTPVAAPRPEPVTISEVSAKLGVHISVDPDVSANIATWTRTSETDVQTQAMLALLESEWDVYPASFIETVDLRHIYLVKDLRVDGQLRAAMPDPIGAHALYYDVSSKYVDGANGQYMRRVIHHEFSHYIDYALHQTYTPYDVAWLSCNPAGFLYGSGGSSAYSNALYANTPHPHSGFITGYAESGVEEDKAEMFAWLITSPGKVSEYTATDENLSCKASLMRQFMSDHAFAL